MAKDTILSKLVCIFTSGKAGCHRAYLQTVCCLSQKGTITLYASRKVGLLIQALVHAKLMALFAWIAAFQG